MGITIVIAVVCRPTSGVKQAVWSSADPRYGHRVFVKKIVLLQLKKAATRNRVVLKKRLVGVSYRCKLYAQP